MKVIRVTALLFLTFIVLTSAQDDIQEEISDEQLEDECRKADRLGGDFEEWKKQFKVKYSSPQEDRRHKFQYCKNVIMVKEYQGSYTMKLGQDAAMSQAEINTFRSLGRLRHSASSDPTNSQRVQSSISPQVSQTTTLPSSLDYSNYNGKNCIGQIKNQGGCGCCWAFAATAFYQSYLCVNGFDYVLSEEASLECTTFEAPNQRENSCNGGYIEDPLVYYSKVGGVLGSDYPYIAGGYGEQDGHPTVHGICTDRHRIFLGRGSVTTYYPTKLTTNQIKTLLVNTGPLMVGIYVNSAFSYYSSGVFTGCPSDASERINHAVLLYGYTSNGDWLIKNSWGTGWGNSGTMILSNSNDCGVSSDIGLMTVDTKNTNVEVNMNLVY